LQNAVTADVIVTLFFRRAFKELLKQKGWKVSDIIMEEYEVIVP
jgi:hypothetical protein